MLGEAHIELRLVDRERNRDRIYVIEVDDDLFGVITVTVTFGRRNAWLRPRRLAVANREEAIRLVQTRLQRRSTARRRLDAAYELVAASGCTDLRAEIVAGWHRLGGADRIRSTASPSARQARPRCRSERPAPPLPLFAA